MRDVGGCVDKNSSIPSEWGGGRSHFDAGISRPLRRPISVENVLVV